MGKDLDARPCGSQSSLGLRPAIDGPKLGELVGGAAAAEVEGEGGVEAGFGRPNPCGRNR